jgi:hypothetical protein
MRPRSFWFPALVCAASLVAAPVMAAQGQGQGQGKPAHAQGPQKPKKPKKAKKAKKDKEHPAHAVDERARFRGLDRNHNGVVSRAEWDGDDRSFAVHDWNRDGVLSGRELDPSATRPAIATPRSAPRGGHEPDEVLFARMDTNNDRRLSRAEWTGSESDWHRLDFNKDGWMSPYEFGVGR